MISSCRLHNVIGNLFRQSAHKILPRRNSNSIDIVLSFDSTKCIKTLVYSQDILQWIVFAIIAPIDMIWCSEWKNEPSNKIRRIKCWNMEQYTKWKSFSIALLYFRILCSHYVIRIDCYTLSSLYLGYIS